MRHIYANLWLMRKLVWQEINIIINNLLLTWMTEDSFSYGYLHKIFKRRVQKLPIERDVVFDQDKWARNELDVCLDLMLTMNQEQKKTWVTKDRFYMDFVTAVKKNVTIESLLILDKKFYVQMIWK